MKHVPLGIAYPACVPLLSLSIEGMNDLSSYLYFNGRKSLKVLCSGIANQPKSWGKLYSNFLLCRKDILVLLKKQSEIRFASSAS